MKWRGTKDAGEIGGDEGSAKLVLLIAHPDGQPGSIAFKIKLQSQRALGPGTSHFLRGIKPAEPYSRIALQRIKAELAGSRQFVVEGLDGNLVGIEGGDWRARDGPAQLACLSSRQMRPGVTETLDDGTDVLRIGLQPVIEGFPTRIAVEVLGLQNGRRLGFGALWMTAKN